MLHSKLATVLVWSLVSLIPVAKSSTSSCKTALTSVYDTELEAAENPNTIKRSLPAVALSAVVWLSAIQLMRSGHSSLFESFKDPAYVTTLAADIGLTAMSHYAALVPGVRSIFKNNLGRYDWPVRSVTLITMGTSAIIASWYLSGIEVNLKSSCMAAGLCTAVYPPLIKLKQGLHQRLPLMIDRYNFKKISNLSKKTSEFKGVSEFLDYSLQSLLDSGLTRYEAESGMMLALEWNFVSKIDFETRLENSKLYGLYSEEVRAIKAASSSLEKQRLRRTLLKQLILKRSHAPEAYEEVLHLGSPLTKRESVLIHRWLLKRYDDYFFQTHAASFVDQAVSVGFAGGVLLYSLNHWLLEL